jgi:hypothetical protein
VITEPLECLTHAPQFSKLGEYELNRFADPSVGMKHDLTHGVAGIPNRKIKGTLSVVELKVIRQRLLAGQEAKARRGELFKRLPNTN